MFQKDPYSSSADNAGRIGHSMKPVSYNPPQGYHPDQQPYRDYDHPPSRYDVSSSSGGGGYPEPKYRNYDSNPPYENSVPHYDQQQWNPYNQPLSTANSSPGYDPRLPYGDGPDAQYTPPLRYDEPPPPQQQGFDGRPRYGKPTGPGPVRYDDPPPPAPGPDLHYDQDSHLSAYSPPPATTASGGSGASRSPDPAAQRSAYNQGPTLQQKGYKPQQYDPTPVNSDTSPTPPPKAEAPSASPVEMPRAAPTEQPEDDPAMRPQSVLTRVKMFENKRSVSMDRARDAGDSAGNRVKY